MTAARAHLQAKLDRAHKRVEQIMAQQALSDMRRKTREDAKARHEQRRRREEFGEAVEEAGLGAWSKAEVSGLLLRAREHFGGSETTRRMLATRSVANPETDSGTVH